MKLNDPTGDEQMKKVDVPYTDAEIAEHLEHETPEDIQRVTVLHRLRETWKETEPKPDLTVRCSDIRAKKKHCRHEMAWVFVIDGLHYCRYKTMPFIDATLANLATAHDLAATGRDGHAARMTPLAGEPVVADTVLELHHPAMYGRVLMGCEPQHGDVAVSVNLLIAEADGTRPTLNVRPSERFVG